MYREGMGKLRRRNIVVGVCGSIAAYKAAELVRLLIKRGFKVRVVMTPSACKFISPITFQALSSNPVLVSLWEEGNGDGIGHIELADWADAVIVAPLSANTLAKLAHGICDNSLLAVSLATKAPVLVAPAMNVNMWENQVTQDNIRRLSDRGVEVVSPETGSLACGWVGSGRLAGNQEIFWRIARATSHRDLEGKRVVITAGPTREDIDPVRYLTNRSSGRMGIALARDAYRRGAKVVLVTGPLGYNPFIPRDIERISVVSATDMHRAVLAQFTTADVLIMAAAVSDFRPASKAEHKLKKSTGFSRVELAHNSDIIADLGSRRKGGHPFLVAFSVETNDDVLEQEAGRKLRDKGVDMLVANSASEAFDKKTNQVLIVSNTTNRRCPHAHKSVIARAIFDEIIDKSVMGMS